MLEPIAENPLLELKVENANHLINCLQGNIDFDYTYLNDDEDFRRMLKEYNLLLFTAKSYKITDKAQKKAVLTQFSYVLFYINGRASKEFPEFLKKNVSKILYDVENISEEIKEVELTYTFRNVLNNEEINKSLDTSLSLRDIVEAAANFVALPGYGFIDQKIKQDEIDKAKPVWKEHFKNIIQENEKLMSSIEENYKYNELMIAYRQNLESVKRHNAEFIERQTKKLLEDQSLSLEDRKLILELNEWNMSSINDQNNISPEDALMLEQLDVPLLEYIGKPEDTSDQEKSHIKMKTR